MRLPHPSRLQARDYLVIVAHKAALDEAGRKTPEVVDRLLEREFEQVHLAPEDDLVPVPYLEVEEGRETDPAAYRFAGPALHRPRAPLSGCA